MRNNSEERYQLITILLIVFIVFIGVSMPYPIFPPLFLHPTHGAIVPDDWHENSRSIFLGIALAAYPLGQFIGLPIFGSCSDRYGRKRMLMISLIGSLIGYCISAMSLQFHWLWPLIASRFLTGLMEGNLAIVRAMAADFTSINKYKSFGRISGAASIGYLMGPLLGGFLSDSQLVPWFSFATPFFLAVLLTSIAALLALTKLKEIHQEKSSYSISLWKQFNLLHRFQLLFKNPTLKYLLIVSSIFTLAIDIFYEFGPIYLTGTWLMTPAWLAFYNVALCITLTIGHTWLSYGLSLFFPRNKTIVTAIISMAVMLSLMVIWPSKFLVFLLFALCGFSIAIGSNNITIQISDTANKKIQGEVMGAQLGLRMLGDAIICLIGGFIIIASVSTPLIICSIIALISAGIYALKSSK